MGSPVRTLWRKRDEYFNGALCFGTSDWTFNEVFMAKAYWITFYREIIDPNRLAAYAKLAGPSIEAGGGRFLARGMPAKAYEAGLMERVVLIEFDSLEKAIATHESSAYRAALAALEGGVVRDLRIVPGV